MKILCVTNKIGFFTNEKNELEKKNIFIEIIEGLPSENEIISDILKRIKDKDVIISIDNNLAVNKFIDSLKNIYKVFICVDDPDGAEERSKPFLKFFNHCFTGAIMYNSKKSMIEKYLEWGAKKADYWLLGIFENRYDSNLKKEEILGKERDIDLIHVGNPQNKTARLLKIYKAFPKMRLYGRTFGIKGLLRTYWHIIKRKKGWYEDIPLFDLDLIKMFLHARELTDLEVVRIRQRSKIEINFHQSYGPGNIRLFDSTANGEMQICDCYEGLGKVFTVGKEVIVFQDEKEAIKKIKYYLKKDAERKKIALAGWKRCLKDYKRITLWEKSLKKIKKGMIEEGINYYKDGTKIE